MIAVGAARFGSQVGRMTSIVAATGAVGGIVGPWLMCRTLVLAGPRPMMVVALGSIAAMLASVVIVEGVSHAFFQRIASVRARTRANLGTRPAFQGQPGFEAARGASLCARYAGGGCSGCAAIGGTSRCARYPMAAPAGAEA